MRGRYSAIRGWGYVVPGMVLLLALATRSTAQEWYAGDEAMLQNEIEMKQQYWIDSYGFPGCNGACGASPCCKILIVND